MALSIEKLKKSIKGEPEEKEEESPPPSQQPPQKEEEEPKKEEKTTTQQQENFSSEKSNTIKSIGTHIVILFVVLVAILFYMMPSNTMQTNVKIGIIGSISSAVISIFTLIDYKNLF